eukprot:8535787-Karenia_brevis.AAC.1
MDTTVMFLKKDKELKVEEFDEDEWLVDSQEEDLEDTPTGESDLADEDGQPDANMTRMDAQTGSKK